MGSLVEVRALVSVCRALAAAQTGLRRIVALMLTLTCVVAVGAALAQPAAAKVLLVCPQPGSASCPTGSYASIQNAVNATSRGDWVLVGPGDYHQQGVPGASEPAGVLIRTPWIHLRGMNRNSVIVDGTKPGAGACSPRLQDQQTGDTGRNGVVAYKVDGVYVENLTACNFLTGNKGGDGNQIWWNGGDGSGQIGMGPWWGSYLTATSTYSNGVDPPFGDYGIFASNAMGPGSVDHSYASNMGDASYYVGACPDCNAVVNHAHAQYSSLGFSGTNAGGHLTIENSEFDHNKTGPTQDSENNDDAPPPQNGQCPGSAPGPLGNGICDVWHDNYIHDNNNANVPGNAANGLAGAAPVGAGAVLAGTENTELYRNRIENNGSWGVLLTDQPYMGNPPPVSHCEGGIYVAPPPSPQPLCYFQSFGNQVVGNSFRHNGGYGNPTNGDIGLATVPHNPGNCFHDNVDPPGVSSDPPAIQSPPYNPCGQTNGNPDPVLVSQVLCATQLVGPCPALPAANYPRATIVVLHMPPAQPRMPNPCQGVPDNAWCQANKPTSSAPL